jgi:uncharacterized damage-inducible protein DinB
VIGSVRDFTDYFEGVRRRTVGFFRMIPAEMIDWAPKDGEYTCGDIVRHVATAESMFTGVVTDGAWRYDGHARALAATREEALALLDARHSAALGALARTGDAALGELRPALEPGGRPIRGWRVLMAMCEHEVHHRSQLASYLTMMGVDAPDIFGLGVEDVERLATAGPPTAVSAPGAAPVSLGPPTAEGDTALRYSGRTQ